MDDSQTIQQVNDPLGISLSRVPQFKNWQGEITNFVLQDIEKQTAKNCLVVFIRMIIHQGLIHRLRAQ